MFQQYCKAAVIQYLHMHGISLHVKMADCLSDEFASSSRSLSLDPDKKEVTRCGPSLNSLHLKYK